MVANQNNHEGFGTKFLRRRAMCFFFVKILGKILKSSPVKVNKMILVAFCLYLYGKYLVEWQQA